RCAGCGRSGAFLGRALDAGLPDSSAPDESPWLFAGSPPRRGARSASVSAPARQQPADPSAGAPAAAPAPPPRALVCEEGGRSLARLRAPLCECCGAPTAWPVTRCSECSGRRLAFSSARAAVAYTGVARQLVQSWKERGLRPLAAVAAELVLEVVPKPAADV